MMRMVKAIVKHCWKPLDPGQIVATDLLLVVPSGSHESISSVDDLVEDLAALHRTVSSVATAKIPPVFHH